MPIPGEKRMMVDDVRTLCEACGKDFAVVVSDGPENTWQFVTWGRTARDKASASQLAQAISDDLGCDPDTERVVENFVMEAAQNKEKLEAVTRQRNELVAHLATLLQETDDGTQLCARSIAEAARECLQKARS